jgi:hypothetical protein
MFLEAERAPAGVVLITTLTRAQTQQAASRTPRTV